MGRYFQKIKVKAKAEAKAKEKFVFYTARAFTQTGIGLMQYLHEE